MTNKTIFWDMDYTLGSFGQIAYEMEGRKIPDYLPDFGLRPGIEELLSELSGKGYKQYITSSASGDYVAEVLKRTGINKYFDKIYSREDIDGLYSPKDYKHILNELNISLINAEDNTIIIGDREGDIPSDINDVVTILDKFHFMRNASLTRIMINMLEENGQGSFNKGFQELYAKSKKLPKTYDFLQDIGEIIIEDDAELHLEFMESRENCSGAPVFEVYKADNYFSYKINNITQEKKR
jgi:hypothetical protein